MTTTQERASEAVPPPRPTPSKKRTRYVVAAGGCVLAVVAVIVLSVVLSENVVYFRTVSEAVKDRTSQGTSRFRIAGAVVPGTIRDHGQTVEFNVTDGKKTVTVVHHGDRPVLFKNGAPVVCEGKWRSPTAGAPFESDRILIKHGSDYSPPKVNTKKAPASESADKS
ncbi:MAG: cytochrome c maturation protein CcmE [Acidimicrobiia bacterium]